MDYFLKIHTFIKTSYNASDKPKFCGHFCTYDELYVITICLKTLCVLTNNQLSK